MASGTGLPKQRPSKKLGIIAGIEAGLGHFPHVVAMKIDMDATTNWQCPGVLFAHNLVITSGKLFINITGTEHFTESQRI
jgi:hypothetical protein